MRHAIIAMAALLAAPPPAIAENSPVPDAALARLGDIYARHMLTRDIYAAQLQGVPPRLPSLSRDDLQGQAAFANDLRMRVQNIPEASLRGEDRLTRASLIWLLRDAETWPQDYLFTFPGPYSYFDLNTAGARLASTALASPEQRDDALLLLVDIAARFDAVAARTRAQRDTGILMPKGQVPRAIKAAQDFRADAATWIDGEDKRLAALNPSERTAFIAKVRAARERIDRAVGVLIGALGPDYSAAAPAEGGMSRYPGGRDYYRMLIRRNITFDRTPDQMRALGERLVAENNRQIEALVAKLRIPGGRAGLRVFANTDPRFIPKTAGDVAAHYDRCIARIEPKLASYFSLMPRAPYRAVPLAASASGMTFGYYEPPSPANSYGEYHFNVSDLSHRSMLTACALIFHELVPGHHFHLAAQIENPAIPPFRRAVGSFGAFNEGWAEYASNLALEMDAYPDDYDRLGRLMLNAMTFGRLLVDPGLNYDGWTYDQARAWMRANTFASDVEIESEILRYSADLPAQALAYGAGFDAFATMRKDLASKLGTRFDIRAFHREAVGHGALPLSVLEDDVQRVLVRGDTGTAK